MNCNRKRQRAWITDAAMLAPQARLAFAPGDLVFIGTMPVACRG